MAKCKYSSRQNSTLCCVYDLNVIKTYGLDILDISDSVSEIQRLARSYIDEAIIPKKKLEDALHIAVCTVFGIDVLLSWNYKHLSNINKERLISSINIKNGYSHILRLVTPMEVMYDD